MYQRIVENEAKALYAYLEGVKLTIQTQISDAERARDERIAEINEEIKRAEARLRRLT